MNKAMIIGNLGQDPELKHTSGGTAVCTLNVATTDRRKNKDGDYEEQTEWHKCIVWGKTAENAAKYLKKGSKVFCEGRLQTRKWENKDGVTMYSTEINAFVLDYLDSRSKDDSQASGGGYQEQSKPAASGQVVGSDINDIPF